MVHQARKAKKPPALNRASVADGLARASVCCEECWYSIGVHGRGIVIKKFYTSHQ